jgi:hypothetical protein
MPSPLQAGDPPQLGVYRLTGRLDERPAGIVYLAVDPSGRQVSLALLHRGAATDAAARDRFRAAIVNGEGLAWIAPQVVAAEPDGPTPWVATVYGADDPGAAVFLEPVAVAGATPAPAYGPGFQHYWAGDQRPAAPPAGWGFETGLPGDSAAVTRKGPRWSLVAGVVTLGVLLVILMVLVVSLVKSGKPVAAAPTGAPTASVPSPSPSASSKQPGAQPTATGVPYGKVPFSNAKVKGPTWGKGDKTYTMKLPEIGLVFRTPPKWGCMRSSSATPPNIRWTCIDEGGSMSGAALTIELRTCDNGCPASAQKAARKEVSPQGNWTMSDRSTSYSQWTDGGDQKIMTLHFYHQGNDRKGVNAEVIALGVAGKPSQTDAIWKTLNDIRANTP